MKKSCLFIFLILVLLTSCNVITKSSRGNEVRYKEPISNQIFDLREGYLNGWVSKETLKSISFYHCGMKPNEDFKPKEKVPNELSDDQLQTIRNIIWGDNPDVYYTDYYEEGFTKDDIEIRYYGTYDDYIAMSIWIPWLAYTCEWYIYKIGGVKFVYWGNPFVSVVKLN